MNYSKTSKRDISYFNFEQFSKPDSTNKESLAASGWTDNASWMLPQLTTLLGSKLILVQGDEGYSATATLAKLKTTLANEGFTFSNGLEITGAKIMGIFNILNHSPRGEILPKGWKQSSGEGLRYSTAVPLILSAFKECRDIGYNDWDWSDKNMHHLVDKDTLELSSVFRTFENPFMQDEILEFREIGRTIKSGASKDSKKAYHLTTTLNGIAHPLWKPLPRLLKLMMCQVWVYHPTIRHKFAITDPIDLDNVAPPLVSTDLLDVPQAFNSAGVPSGLSGSSLGSDNLWNLD